MGVDSLKPIIEFQRQDLFSDVLKVAKFFTSAKAVTVVQSYVLYSKISTIFKCGLASHF